jgi:hypothetical protein
MGAPVNGVRSRSQMAVPHYPLRLPVMNMLGQKFTSKPPWRFHKLVPRVSRGAEPSPSSRGSDDTAGQGSPYAAAEKNKVQNGGKLCLAYHDDETTLTVVESDQTIKTIDIEEKILQINWEAVAAPYVGSALFILGLILMEVGIEGLLNHYLGDSVLGSVSCIVFGLSAVFWVKLNGYQCSRIFDSGFFK